MVIRNNTHAVKRSFKYSVLRSAPNTKYGNGIVIVRIKFPLILLLGSYRVRLLLMQTAIQRIKAGSPPSRITSRKHGMNLSITISIFRPLRGMHVSPTIKKKQTVITNVRGGPASVSLAGMKKVTGMACT